MCAPVYEAALALLVLHQTVHTEGETTDELAAVWEAAHVFAHGEEEICLAECVVACVCLRVVVSVILLVQIGPVNESRHTHTHFIVLSYRSPSLTHTHIHIYIYTGRMVMS